MWGELDPEMLKMKEKNEDRIYTYVWPAQNYL